VVAGGASDSGEVMYFRAHQHSALEFWAFVDLRSSDVCTAARALKDVLNRQSEQSRHETDRGQRQPKRGCTFAISRGFGITHTHFPWSNPKIDKERSSSAAQSSQDLPPRGAWSREHCAVVPCEGRGRLKAVLQPRGMGVRARAVAALLLRCCCAVACFLRVRRE